MSKPFRIVLLGSCNGQDSLGDVCLLKAVVSQCRISDQDAQISVHMNETSHAVEKLMQVERLNVNWGLQTLFWRWQTRWRHSLLPRPVYRFIAALSFPLYLAISGLVRGTAERRALSQIFQADVIYVYGGTNFAKRWYWINTQYFVLTMFLARLSGARVILGPQQFGPMTVFQKMFTRFWLKMLVSEYYLRNANCLKELNVPAREASNRLLRDEVYSNTSCYPVFSRRPKAPQYILFNIRGGNLSDEQAFEAEDMAGLGQLLSGLQRHFGLPIRWFVVSGESFSDDAAGARALEPVLRGDGAFDPRQVSDEHELIDAAGKALACISMSFHGCILCATAGIPSVPIIDGSYYEYKYADFDRYGDGQPVPRLRLRGQSASLPTLVSFIESFDAEAAARGRLDAAQAIQRVYGPALVLPSRRRHAQF